ncbi:MAG: hypothetical protein MUC86_02955 [Burkholderiaceae bacterium]|jgi:hypothetical protein|nr:hypothetical protein [Burkholderiaceae bacterium]
MPALALEFAPASLQRLRRVARAWAVLAVLLLGAVGWLARSAPQAVAAQDAGLVLVPGDVVRIKLGRPDSQRMADTWLEGRAAIAPLGCTLVLLPGRERELGAGSVRLATVRELQRADAASGWTTLPLERLRSAEPEGCARD